MVKTDSYRADQTSHGHGHHYNGNPRNDTHVRWILEQLSCRATAGYFPRISKLGDLDRRCISSGLRFNMKRLTGARAHPLFW
jgi:hypothetical protein